MRASLGQAVSIRPLDMACGRSAQRWPEFACFLAVFASLIVLTGSSQVQLPPFTSANEGALGNATVQRLQNDTMRRSKAEEVTAMRQHRLPLADLGTGGLPNDGLGVFDSSTRKLATEGPFMAEHDGSSAGNEKLDVPIFQEANGEDAAEHYHQTNNQRASGKSLSSSSRELVSSSGRRTVLQESTTISGRVMYISLNVAASATVQCSENCQIVVEEDCTVDGKIRCTTPMCKITIAARNISISTNGMVQGGDLKLSAESDIKIAGVIKADGLGHGNGTGTGKGTSPTPGSSASSYWYRFYGSGGGGGYGGVGANSCFRYGSSAYVNPQTYGAGASYGESLAPQSFGSGGGNGQLFYWSSTASE